MKYKKGDKVIIFQNDTIMKLEKQVNHYPLNKVLIISGFRGISSGVSAGYRIYQFEGPNYSGAYEEDMERYLPTKLEKSLL